MNKTKKVWITIGSTLLGLYILFLISPLVLSPVIDSYSDEIEDTLKIQQDLMLILTIFH